MAAVAISATALVTTSSAVTSTNKYEAFQGSVNIKGISTIAGKVPASDVKVSAMLTGQLSGPTVKQPAAGTTIGVAGEKDAAVKVTNKQIIEFVLGAGNATGKKIKWSYYFSPSGEPKSVLAIYDNSNFETLIPASYLTLNVGWAQDYAGVYGGSASLTASSTVSGTSVYISAGKLNGLTEISGTYLGFLNYAGVGKFSGDSKKQLSASARISAGDVNP